MEEQADLASSDSDDSSTFTALSDCESDTGSAATKELNLESTLPANFWVEENWDGEKEFIWDLLITLMNI